MKDHPSTREVWKIEYHGSSYCEPDYRIVFEVIKDMDTDDTYSITKILMDEEEYNNLPEFQGF